MGYYLLWRIAYHQYFQHTRTSSLPSLPSRRRVSVPFPPRSLPMSAPVSCTKRTMVRTAHAHTYRIQQIEHAYRIEFAQKNRRGIVKEGGRDGINGTGGGAGCGVKIGGRTKGGCSVLAMLECPQPSSKEFSKHKRMACLLLATGPFRLHQLQAALMEPLLRTRGVRTGPLLRVETSKRVL